MKNYNKPEMNIVSFSQSDETSLGTSGVVLNLNGSTGLKFSDLNA